MSTFFRPCCCSNNCADHNYPRFGNFIGEAEESEEESSQNGANAPAFTYDDLQEEEPAPDFTGQELMELDGMRPVLTSCATSSHLEHR